ncbi:cytochrome P450 [Nitzschia inconspicua]|uniref:Cytochrome P450 n=1 Tax=Nitzschia inconspicua TaxID=303405 RepID=A0A9K3PED1_9STRA|nr:cytochrome P450 [Nitzschia inconspicua]
MKFIVNVPQIFLLGSVLFRTFCKAQEDGGEEIASQRVDVRPMHQVLRDMQDKLALSESTLPPHVQGVFWMDQSGYLTPDLPKRPKDRVGQNAIVAFDGIDDTLSEINSDNHILTVDHTGPAWPFFNTKTGNNIFQVQASETSFYRWYFDETFQNTQVYYYKPHLQDGNYYPSAQVAGVDVNLTMHYQEPAEECYTGDAMDILSGNASSSVDIAKCATWIRTTVVVHPDDRSREMAVLPDYYVYPIVNGTGHAIEPFYSAFLKYAQEDADITSDLIDGSNDNGLVGRGGQLASILQENAVAVEPSLAVWHPSIQDYLVDANVARICKEQEQLLRNGVTLENDTTGVLSTLYAQDLVQYIANPSKFLRRRSHVCGGGNRNFCSMGRVILGDYGLVQDTLVKSDIPQTRGWYLGRAKLNPERLPPFFLLAMSDGGSDTDEGRSGVHDILRKAMIDTIIVPAQQRVLDSSLQSELNIFIDEMIEQLDKEAKMGTPDVNTTLTTDVVGTFVTKWAFKVILDMDVDPQIISVIKTLFLMPSLSIYGFWVEPFASQLSFEDGAKIIAAFDSLVSVVERSPVLQGYSPSESNFFLTKYDYARELAAFFSGASLLGVQHFILNIFTRIVPSDDYVLLDPDDSHMLGNALLEAARFNPPVKNVNVILSENTSFKVGGADQTFPAGTSVMASILLSGFDEDFFPDSYTFDVERANLKSSLLTFASMGYDPQYSFDTGRRSCLGQHLVFKLSTDVLSAWLRRNGGPSIPSTGNSPSLSGGSIGEIPTSACVAKFAALGFESDNFHLYHRYFRDDSKFIYPPAGVYQGTLAIEEYVAFVSLRNPIFKEKSISNVNVSLKTVDSSEGTCTFIINSSTRYLTDPEFFVESDFMVTAMTKLIYNYHEDYIKEIDLFYTDAFLKFVMARSYTRSEHICNVHAGCLNKTNDDQDMTKNQCLRRLAALPTYTEDEEGRGYIDGNSYACRALHSQLAEFDDFHCPHVAFAATEDPKGGVKCQESEYMRSSEFFDDEDMAGYERYIQKLNAVLGSQGDIDPTLGFKILSLPPEENRTRSLIAGVIVPIILFLVVYLGIRCVKPETILTSPDSKRLWTIAIVWVVMLGSIFGFAAMTIWGIGQRNPEWSDAWAHNGMSRYPALGKQATPSGTEIQSRLDDVEFYVYVGFILWITTLIAGVGMEALVWIYFIRVWSEERERYWRFAQFFFPLFAMTSLGLALYRNYFSLPVMVFGLWKFGFPETLMYIYLGIFGRQGSVGRTSDFLNGIGTAVHHGSASFIIAMLTVGVIPPSRYLISPILILIMQHWVALIAYSSRALYSAIELVLDYFFQWSVLSNFQQLFHLHWTAALGGSCMLFAHWMYLTAAVLSLFASSSGDDKDEDQSNVHSRGVELMTTPPQPKKANRRRSKKGRLHGATRRSYGFRNLNNTSIDLAHNYLATRQREPPGLHHEEEIVFFRDDPTDDGESGFSTSSQASNDGGDVQVSRLLPILLKHINDGRLDDSNGNLHLTEQVMFDEDGNNKHYKSGGKRKSAESNALCTKTNTFGGILKSTRRSGSTVSTMDPSGSGTFQDNQFCESAVSARGTASVDSTITL